jgi:hypothetical protein
MVWTDVIIIRDGLPHYAETRPAQVFLIIEGFLEDLVTAVASAHVDSLCGFSVQWYIS